MSPQVSAEIRSDRRVQHQTPVGQLLHQGQDRGLQSVPYDTGKLTPVGQLRSVLQPSVVQDRHGIQAARVHDRTVPGTFGVPDVQEPSQIRSVQQSYIGATQQVSACLFSHRFSLREYLIIYFAYG